MSIWGTMTNTSNVVWNYSGYLVQSSGVGNSPVAVNVDTDAEENRKADMEETIAELEEALDDLRAELFGARLLLGRIMRGDQPTDEELEPHLEAVAEEFE